MIAVAKPNAAAYATAMKRALAIYPPVHTIEVILKTGIVHRRCTQNTAAYALKIAVIVDGKRGSMPNGTIKRLVRDRGFGFIRDDGGQEWFFHRSGVQGSFDQLAEGQRVAFDEESSPKGPRAGNVRPE